MPDVWTTVSDLDLAMQERLAGVLEARGTDPQQQAVRHNFLSGLDIPADAHVADIGCGTGVLTRVRAQWPNVKSVIGVDPAPYLIREARRLADHLATVRFQVADGGSLPFDAEALDVAVFDSTLCHVPSVERVVAETHRVLHPAGWLAVFDGDYATATRRFPITTRCRPA